MNLFKPYTNEEHAQWSSFPVRMNTHEAGNQLAHSNECFEFIKLLRGHVHIVVDGNAFNCKEGDIMFVPEDVVREILFIEPGSAVMSIAFGKNAVSALISSFSCLQLFGPLRGSTGCRLSRGDAGWSIISSTMEQAYSDYRGKPPFYKLSIQANLYQIMSAILRFRSESGTFGDDTLSTRQLDSLGPVFAYVEASYKEPIYLEQAAHLLMMSPVYFGKVFKKRTGITFNQYLISFRVRTAKKLLKQSLLSITEISEQSGFCNINYFARMFKREVGMTPQQFRKKTLKDSLL